jgi:hypothetical protein
MHACSFNGQWTSATAISKSICFISDICLQIKLIVETFE